jgi:hypothetical protein
MKIGNFYVNPELDRAEVDRRVEAAQSWLDGMDEVVRHTKDDEATGLTEEMLSGVVVLKPSKRDVVVPVQGPEPEKLTIALIPLFKEDKRTTKTARQLMSEGSKEAARFTENDPGRVYFNAEIPMSGLWKGLIGLLEAKYISFFCPMVHFVTVSVFSLPV